MFRNLPAGFHAYVDGKPASVNDGELTLIAGKHEIQLEAPVVPSVWQASRQTVNIMPNQTGIINGCWAPLVLSEHGFGPYCRTVITNCA